MDGGHGSDEGRREVRLPLHSLRALRGLEGLEAGPLSPLSGMEASSSSADARALAQALREMEGAWEWALPCLADPRNKAAFFVAGECAAMACQYLFPDADAAGPGFRAAVSGDRLALTGPWTVGEARAELLRLLALDEVTESPPARLDLGGKSLLALAAFVDAYRASCLARDLLHVGGEPGAVSAAEVSEAWRAGVSAADPAWAVSMLSLLAPEDLAPRDGFSPAERLEGLARGGLISRVEGEGSGPRYAPRGDLARLCREVARSNTVFGILAQRLAAPGRLEMGLVFGWRTGRGVWAADLGGAGERDVSILQLGPHLAAELLAEMLPETGYVPPREFAMDTPWRRELVLSRLEEAESVSPQAPPSGAGTVGTADIVSGAGAGVTAGIRPVCAHCGQELVEGARFCRGCGRAVEAPARTGPAPAHKARPRFCRHCGQPLREGARFCRKCGGEQTRGS